MNGIGFIISKELTRVFKDRKMIFSLFILPVVLVIGIFTLMGTMIQNVSEDIEAHIPVVYMMDAPDSFKSVMNGAGLGFNEINSEAQLSDAKNMLLEKSVDVVIVFEKEFDSKVMTGIDSLSDIVVPGVEIYYNPSEDYSSQAKTVLTSCFDMYKQSLLANRFGSLDAVSMFNVNENIIQDEDKAMGKMLGMMLPYFITMLIFASAMGLGSDMIAGEKERGTLQSLLLTPLNRTSIVLGKVIALSILAVLSSAVYMVSMVVAMPVMFKDLGDMGGLSINFTPGQIIMLIVLTVGVVLLYVSAISFVSVLAKDIKEASTFLSPLYMVVIIAGMITMYVSANGVFAKYLIPVYGSSMAFKDILTREITMQNFLGATFSTYLLAIVLVLFMTKAFNSEKVMFNA